MQEGSDEITDEGTITTFNGAAVFKCLSVFITRKNNLCNYEFMTFQLFQ